MASPQTCLDPFDICLALNSCGYTFYLISLWDLEGFTADVSFLPTLAREFTVITSCAAMIGVGHVLAYLSPSLCLINRFVFRRGGRVD